VSRREEFMQDPADDGEIPRSHVEPVQVASEVIGAFPFPCALVDRLGRCVDRNEAFDRTLAVLPVSLAVGRIRFSHAEWQSLWEDALAQTCDTAAPVTLKLDSDPFRPWTVHLSPLRGVLAAPGRAQPAVLVVVQGRAPLAAIQVRNQARLTQAENEVLGALLRGRSAKVIANARGASVNTVRAQIMSILNKTGAGSQKELIADSAFSDSGPMQDGYSAGGAPSAGRQRTQRS
jgi:DNA-binding CsgD family transcriptional regulator